MTVKLRRRHQRYPDVTAVFALQLDTADAVVLIPVILVPPACHGKRRAGLLDPSHRLPTICPHQAPDIANAIALRNDARRREHLSIELGDAGDAFTTGSL